MDSASGFHAPDIIDETLVAEAPMHPLPAAAAVALDRQADPGPPVGGVAKRCFDVLVALALLVPLLPVMAFVAMVIVLGDGFAPLFGHERFGHRGRRFLCLKFRSMVVDAAEVLDHHLKANPEAAEEWRLTHKLRDDPRVTRIGRLLRVTSLDELPQIFNVLRGDMSLVGPRPVVAEEILRYGDAFSDYCRCRPGITGLWQVGGRSDCDYARRVEYDMSYVRDWTPALDLAVLLRTVPAVALRKGSC